MSDATFETYYAPGLGAKYAARAWIISAVILAVGVPVTWFTFVGNPQWWVLVLVGLVFAFLLAVTIGAAVIAPAKWGTDGRLAVRLDETGMTLPRIGTLAWDEIASIGIVDTGFVHGNVAFRAWEVLTGSSNNRFVTVWLKDPAAVLTRIGDPVGGVKEVAEAYSFRGVFGEGLRSPGWGETVAALQQAAVRHNIELHGRKSPAMVEPQGLLAEKAALGEVNGLLYGLIGSGDTGVVFTVVGATSVTNQYDFSVLNPAGRYDSPDGRCNDAERPDGLYDAVRRLRAAMHREGSGTWFSAVFRVTKEGSATAEFDYENEPRWDAAPDPEVYVADLENFPRDEAHLPEWLKVQLARAKA